MAEQSTQSDHFALRPAVISLAIRERAALYTAYMPFFTHGGIFVPTNKNCQLGEEIFYCFR